MNLRSRALADRGYRLAGCPPLPAGRAAAPVSPPPDAGAATICTVALTDAENVVLTLGARAEGVDRAEFVRRAIPFYADKHVGLPALTGERKSSLPKTAHEKVGGVAGACSAFEQRREPDAILPTRKGAGMERGIDRCVTAGETASFTSDGDLLFAPEPVRFGPNRFRSHAPP